MTEPLAKEYVYPPDPTTHGMVDEDCEFEGEDEEGGHYGPFE